MKMLSKFCVILLFSALKLRLVVFMAHRYFP